MRRGNWRGRGANGRPWSRGFRNRNVSDNRSSQNSTVAHTVQSTHTQSSTRAPSNQLPITVFVNDNNKAWKLYFPAEDPTAETSKYIKCFKDFIHRHRSLFDLEKIEHRHSAPLDLTELYKDEAFMTEWPMFKEDLFDKPEHTLSILEYCIHEEFKCESRIRVRVMNHQQIVPLSSLKVNYFGKLVTIKGTVIRVGSVGLICTSATFQCTGCQAIQAVQQPQGVFTVPTICDSCRKYTKLEPLLTSPFTITDDWQVAKIQEIQSQSVSGTIPRSVEVELQGDLVGSICPGDVLAITGIAQVRGESRGGEEGRRAARLLQLYIQAVSVHNQRNLSNPTLSFTLTDYYAIQEIHASEDVFRLLVHSLCPSIFGQEAVKAGLILGLLGGTPSEAVGVTTRCDPHVLVVGDPGLGKSQLLQAAANAAPRGVYVCGASSSAGGLTVSLGREAGGDFALEAGALVLADRGVCCVDELDKMTAHHSSLLEAMEQGRVSVAKGGVVCSLSARATVLAAANPAAGNYNRAKTVAENLKINSALLSRFDLVFILLDQPDKTRDAMLSEHVLALHSGNKIKSNNASASISFQLNSQSDEENPSLSKRLSLKPGEVIDTLPVVLLRKYIAYARRYVHPKLTEEAAKALQEFYLELRRNHQEGLCDGPPITTRQLEACLRLTQARAKAELREEATVKDAQDVISLVKHSLTDTFSDEFGNIQLSRSIHGSGVSARSSLKRYLDVLTKYALQVGKDTFTKQELVQIHKTEAIKGDPYSLIESMHTHSYLLLKGSNLYQLITL